MALFIWTDALRTGNRHIDDDHRLLVEHVNTVLECIAQRADNARLCQALDALGIYTRTHFAQEEDLMRKAGYARTHAHCAQHQALLEQMEQVMAQLRTHQTIDPMDLYTRLTRWVVEHIQQYDRDFVQSEPALAHAD